MTVNRLCASGLEAVGQAARAIALGEAELAIAGGVESMSRAPYVMGKSDTAFGREQTLQDTTLGWRFVNPAFEARYGVDPMMRTAQNLADEHGIGRADQDAFALRSQQRAAQAIASGRLARELMPAGKLGERRTAARRHHARQARPPSHRRSAPAPASPPATRPASTMAPAPCCSPARMPPRATA